MPIQMSSDRGVLVNTDWEMKDASVEPPPMNILLLCGNIHSGKTVISVWNSAFNFTHWAPYPVFPKPGNQAIYDGKEFNARLSEHFDAFAEMVKSLSFTETGLIDKHMGVETQMYEHLSEFSTDLKTGDTQAKVTDLVGFTKALKMQAVLNPYVS